MLEASRRVGVRRPRPSRCGRIARNDIAQLFLYAEMDRQAARTRWSPYRILPHGMVCVSTRVARTQSPRGFAGDAAAIVKGR